MAGEKVKSRGKKIFCKDANDARNNVTKTEAVVLNNHHDSLLTNYLYGIICCLCGLLVLCCNTCAAEYTTNSAWWWIGTELLCRGIQPVFCWLFVKVVPGGDVNTEAVVSLTHVWYRSNILLFFCGLTIFFCTSSDWWWVGLEMVLNGALRVIFFNLVKFGDNIEIVQFLGLFCFGLKSAILFTVGGLQSIFYIFVIHFAITRIAEFLCSLVSLDKLTGNPISRPQSTKVPKEPKAQNKVEVKVKEDLEGHYKSANISVVMPNICWNCSVTPDLVTLYRCKGCKVARYCGEDCHRVDWAVHRPWCGKKRKEEVTDPVAHYKSANSVADPVVMPIICWNCSVTPDLVTLYRCKGCKVAMYCGEECHRVNWAVHRPWCDKRRREDKEVTDGLYSEVD